MGRTIGNNILVDMIFKIRINKVYSGFQKHTIFFKAYFFWLTIGNLKEVKIKIRKISKIR